MKKIIFSIAFVAISMAAISQTIEVSLRLNNQQEMRGTFVTITDTSITIKPNESVVDAFVIPAEKLSFGRIYTTVGKVDINVIENKIIAKSNKNAALALLGINPTSTISQAKKLESTIISSKTQQPAKYSFVIREGNHYYINSNKYNKKDFLNYLSYTNPTAYNHFNTGYKTANIGWGLFGGGLVSSLVGGIIMASTNSKGAVAVGSLFSTIGGGCVVSGVVCISTGYARMHNSADIYNIQTEHQRLIQLNLNATNSGVGLAFTW